ncbi:MAG: nucleoside triphosphate pyrophosphohydrolase [Pseudomonadales bacterium]|nr:nucleoside triphosphate pyrophosphohydrolase [Pseudomonadales bacterium]
MSITEFDRKSAIGKLIALMSMLRDKDNGCPWDLEQSIESLIPFTLEEVYEVVDAIEKQDMVELEDELGDLLFQVVFYAQIAQEEGLFNFDDVANAITNKLVRRHPHVFPEGQVTNFGTKSDISSEQVVVNWEAIKKQEKENKFLRKSSADSGTEAESILNDVPRAFPALARALKLQKRAAKVGFDWQELSPVVAKLKEEIEELEEAIKDGEHEAIQSELGDVLFAAVNVARHTGVDPELTLRDANTKFENRFKWIESRLNKEGKSVAESSLDDLNQLWEQAKVNGL